MTNVVNAIEVRDLAKSIGKARLLEPLNLTIPCGSVVAFIGHNGAGKTTLLKLVQMINDV